MSTDPLEKLRFYKPTATRLINKRTGKTLATKLMSAKTIFAKGTGLMGRKLKEKEALIFPMKKKRKLSLHMLFVFTPIDVLFCTKKNNGEYLIEEKKEHFKPFTTYKARKAADTFIELPNGSCQEVKEGDTINIKN